MEKINIAELLKDCPKGMELNCTVYDECTLDSILEGELYPIKIQTPEGKMLLTKYGSFSCNKHSKCVIFPKGKMTWEGFVLPYEFKDGDMLATNLGSVFYLNTRLNTDEYYGCYVGIGGDGSFHICAPFAYKECCGLATEEEKQKLSKAIKDNGYKWNAETKTLEKLVEPQFKVGDKITNGKTSITIGYIDDEYYYEIGRNIATRLLIKNQDEWNLIPKRFDINTLIPFESKVLVRHNKDNKWCGSFFSFIDRDFHSHCYKFVTTANKSYPMMIPYKGNEHLLGKTDDCQEFYKTW